MLIMMSVCRHSLDHPVTGMSRVSENCIVYPLVTVVAVLYGMNKQICVHGTTAVIVTVAAALPRRQMQQRTARAMDRRHILE